MRKLLIPLTVALVAAVASASTAGATSAPPEPASATLADAIDTTALRGAVTADGIMTHARALQNIANRNGGTRASGTPGYDASAAYVKGQLAAAGYRVTEQQFTFPFYRELTPPVLTQVSPAADTYETSSLDYSGGGDVTGRVVPANDVVVPPGPNPNSNSAGCEPGDFVPASATEPQIALVQRGTCGYRQKVVNAQAAGYDAVVIFNEGQPGRDELIIGGSLVQPVTIPAVALSYADGAAVYAAAKAGPTVLHVALSVENRPATTSNLTADIPGTNPDQILVVGAHLDSVVHGPGINDNGSAVGTLLEIARQMPPLKITTRQTVRFAFWGAEEFGLLGSKHYVGSLSAAELKRIWANLNFDMVGSPNYVRFVFDGDGSVSGTPGPPGSAEIESIYRSYFTAQGLRSDPIAFDGRSDYAPFMAAGIPAGGVESGVEGVKTADQAAAYGGKAGDPYDSCYHRSCDTVNNVNTTVLAQLSDAAAHSVQVLGQTTTPFSPQRREPGAATSPSLDYVGSHSIR